ncbi:MAG: glycoside hydrolase family 3 N-terminal domain-containing protein [Streptosporangiaceae bacterium]
MWRYGTSGVARIRGNGTTRRWRSWIFLSFVLALGLTCSACAPAPASSAAAGRPSATSARLSSPHPGASRTPPRPAPPSCPALVFSRLTEAQRIGQLFLIGLAGDPVSDVAQAVAAYHFGSLLSAGNLTAGTAELRQLTSGYQALASSRDTGRVRFFIAANQEGGEVQSLRGPGFSAMPPALVQGGLPAADLERQAAVWGGELRSAGVNLDLAPVMDVVPPGTAGQNQPIGMLQREFGDSPAAVAVHGAAFIRGMRQAGVATTAKHFPGLGRVIGNTDFTAGVVDSTTGPDDPYLGSFQGAIDAGVPFVMVALATYTRIDARHLAVFSPRVMRVILRQQLHFQGVIVSDDLGAATAVASLSPGARGIDFLAAGGDLITSQSLSAAVEMDSAILARVTADSAFRALVNAAVMRVLRAKQGYQLLPCPAG